MARASSRALADAAAVGLLGVAALMLWALVRYDPSLPAWSRASTEAPELSAGGYLLQSVADVLFQLLGWLAYPVVVGLGAWAGLAVWRRRWPMAAAGLAWLPVVWAACGLVALAGPETTLPAGAGGALGRLLVDAAVPALGSVGAAIALLTMVASGVVAATGISLADLVRRAWMRLAALKRIQRKAPSTPVPEPEPAADQGAEPVFADAAEPVLSDPEPTLVEKPRAAPPKAKSDQRAERAPGRWVPPALDLFIPGSPAERPSEAALKQMALRLEQALKDYRVEGRIVEVMPGPVVTRFHFEPAPGVKLARVVAIQDDIARALRVKSVRVAGNVPGKNAIGIEVPNERRSIVRLREVLASEAFQRHEGKLPLGLGVDIAGRPLIVDLAKMPHLLVAGTTGSGKSVSINAMLCSLLVRHAPDDLRLILVDPKMLELSVYDGIPHLLAPVVTDPHKAAQVLAWAVMEMERRYQLMSEARVRNLDGYNAWAAAQPAEAEAERLPMIVIVIDELADLMMVAGKEVEQSICRLAQKARAAGIHMILATQRPSVDVITGLIKANLPSRLAFQVSSRVDSRTILDQMGAEQLLGHGDGLLMLGGREIVRVHGALVTDEEVNRVADALRAQGAPRYIEEEIFSTAGGEDEDALEPSAHDDPLYDKAVALVVEKQRCSVSMVQRYLRIGYNRASRIVEQMERDGIVSPPGAGGMRKVLAPPPESGVDG